MPMCDKPLSELREYMGINPCPADIDEYWDAALEEMNNTDSCAEFIPSSFKVNGYEFYDLYFNGVRNSRIHCKFVKPADIKGKAPAVLLFHGYSGDCGPWSNLLKYAAAGFVVCALDARGQGGLSEDKNPVAGPTYCGLIVKGVDEPDPHQLYFRQVYLDTAQMAKIVMGLDYVDETRVAAHGGSQGGALTVACAALVPEINRAFAFYPFLCDYKRVWEMDLDKNAYSEIAYWLRHFDPTHSRVDEFFTRLGYIDLQNIAHRIKADFKMLTCLIDTICPPSTQFAMYNKIKSNKDVIVCPDFGHETPPGLDDMVMQYILEMV